MNIRRAHEGSRHPIGKWELGQLLSRRGFRVLFEHMLADVVAFRVQGGKRRVLCGEHELTPRNLCRNVQRNFARGCQAMVILVPAGSDRSARRLLRRKFPRCIWTHIGILTHESCQRILAREQISSSTTTAADSAATIVRGSPAVTEFIPSRRHPFNEESNLVIV